MSINKYCIFNENKGFPALSFPIPAIPGAPAPREKILSINSVRLSYTYFVNRSEYRVTIYKGRYFGG